MLNKEKFKLMQQQILIASAVQCQRLDNVIHSNNVEDVPKKTTGYREYSKR